MGWKEATSRGQRSTNDSKACKHDSIISASPLLFVVSHCCSTRGTTISSSLPIR